MIAQFGGWMSNLIWLLFFFLLMFFYPRIMLSQMLLRFERTASLLEMLTSKSKSYVLKRMSKKPDKKLIKRVNDFLEFFTVQPVSLDPYGIVKKIEHVINLSKRKLKYFIKTVASGLDEETQANLIMGISVTMSLHQLTKLVKHYIKFIKKTRNVQLGLILQMQLPLIERISKSLAKGAEAMTNGWPIGDGAGAMVAASLMKGKSVEIEEDTLLEIAKIEDKRVMVLKAKGPGGRLGKLGKAVEKLVKEKKVKKIITVDASLKLESEKTGAVAEGVGVALGGIGVDRAYIENIATKNQIPLDAYVIKMSQEEAMMPMKLEVFKATKEVIERIKENIRNSEEKSILLVGVGNTTGIGNDRRAVEEIDNLIRANDKKLKKWEAEEKRKERRLTSWFSPFGF